MVGNNNAETVLHRRVNYKRQNLYISFEDHLFWHFLRTKFQSKWFDRINFDVTQYTSYKNERSKNFTYKECEKHFYPKDDQSINNLGDIKALEIFNFGGLVLICCFMVDGKTTREQFFVLDGQVAYT
jgi:hypothetical protein